jgi:hypothetical protein
MKKLSIKIYLEEDVVFSQKKLMLAGLFLWKISILRLLLEKSGTKSQDVLVLSPSDQKM